MSTLVLLLTQSFEGEGEQGFLLTLVPVQHLPRSIADDDQIHIGLFESFDRYLAQDRVDELRAERAEEMPNEENDRLSLSNQIPEFMTRSSLIFHFKV
jgi:hypothetical protein